MKMTLSYITAHHNKFSLYLIIIQALIISLLLYLWFANKRTVVTNTIVVHEPISREKNSHKKRYEMVMTKYKENTTWITDPKIKDIPAVIYDSGYLDFGPLKKQREIDKIFPIINPKRAQECPGYLTYIVTNYHDLPDVVLFLHSYPFNHNAEMIDYLRYVVDNCTDIDFLHLNPQIYLKYSRNPGQYNQKYPDLADVLPDSTLNMCTYCCAQFAVSKHTILSRSLRFYYTLLKYCQEELDCAHLEHIWHFIFGKGACLRPYYGLGGIGPMNGEYPHVPFPINEPECRKRL
jgi:hypothetical protein